MPHRHLTLTLATANGRPVAITRTGVHIGLLHGADARSVQPQASARHEQRTALDEWHAAVQRERQALLQLHRVCTQPMPPANDAQAHQRQPGQREAAVMRGFAIGLVLAIAGYLVLTAWGQA